MYTSGIFCVSDGKYRKLTVTVYSGGVGRNFSFHIPLWKGVGEFPLKPYIPPYSYCGSGDFTALCEYDDYGFGYLPVNGTFKITAIDTIARSLTATFNMTMLDSLSKTESIILTNGQMKLARY